MKAIRIIEIKNGASTYEKKDELKKDGYKWITNSMSHGWTKEFETMDEIKNEIQKLNEIGFGTSFGAVEKGIFYEGKEAEEKGLVTHEERKEIYFYMKDKNLL